MYCCFNSLHDLTDYYYYLFIHDSFFSFFCTAKLEKMFLVLKNIFIFKKNYIVNSSIFYITHIHKNHGIALKISFLSTCNTLVRQSQIQRIIELKKKTKSFPFIFQILFHGKYFNILNI